MRVARDGRIVHLARSGRPLCAAPVPVSRGDVHLCGECLDLHLADTTTSTDIVFGEDIAHKLERALHDRYIAMPYAEYLTTQHWRHMRALAIDRYGVACALCNSSGSEVHHRTYERLGQERLDDLIVLCRSCHKKHHGIPKAA